MELKYQILLISFIIGYIIGSIPCGYIIAKIFAKKDLTKMGSGATGMTNTWRAAGPFAAVLTLILDAIKPVIAGLIVWEITSNVLGNLSSIIYIVGRLEELKTMIIALTGLFAIIGHCYSIFLKFKGGKGAASMLGLMIFLNPIATISIFGIWFLIFILTNIVSISTLIALTLYPALVYFINEDFFEYMKYILYFLVIWGIIMHGKNIKR
ncbi:MAG: glycerol-3-phosphate acyltransferase, partial [Rickettsiales bacterium]|nr:glycerol-3-phosphate acyltransferase [Rickettsiales bacterium]